MHPKSTVTDSGMILVYEDTDPESKFNSRQVTIVRDGTIFILGEDELIDIIREFKLAFGE